MEISKGKIKTAIRVARKCAVNPYVIGGILGTAVFAADQIFKSSIEMQDDTNFPHDPAVEKDAVRVEFEKKHNPGICGGVLADHPRASTMLSATGLILAGASLALRRKKDFIGKVSDMVVIGGAASNLYDKMKRGYVVDYIHAKKGPLSRLVFNIADVAIVAGTVAGSVSRALTGRRRIAARIEQKPRYAVLPELKQRTVQLAERAKNTAQTELKNIAELLPEIKHRAAELLEKAGKGNSGE